MFDWVKYGDLPPAGSRLEPWLDCNSQLEFAGYVVHCVNSGTAALAAALMMAKNKYPGIQSPEVLLPAYACPDLLAAAKFAGVRPILVDIGSNDPGFSIDALRVALTANAVAVVAVNFLGIRERLSNIRELLSNFPSVSLIEDNAQWFPEPITAPDLHGDLVCLSFGRGKPVSLLGGGAVLTRKDRAYVVPAHVTQPIAPQTTSLRLKAVMFNMLLSRHFYWLVNRNPFFSLGETKLKTLQAIHAIEPTRLALLTTNARGYLQRQRWVELQWRAILEEGAVSTKIEQLSVDPGRYGRLLRYPLLCRDRETRDSLWQTLHQAGLGPSRMYQRVLPEIDGVHSTFGLNGSYPGAKSFADRLLTLPVHEQVNPSDIRRAAEILSA